MSATPRRDRLFGWIAERIDCPGALLNVTLVPPLGSWQWWTSSPVQVADGEADLLVDVRRFGWALTLLAKALRWTPHGELREYRDRDGSGS